MTVKSISVCDACGAESPLSDSCKFIRLWDKSQFDLCDGCFDRLMGWVKKTCLPSPGERHIIYRGSVTDFATDIAFELSPEQARIVIDELERFLIADLAKFKSQ